MEMTLSFYKMQCSLPTHDGRDHIGKYYSLMSMVKVFRNRVVHPKKNIDNKYDKASIDVVNQSFTCELTRTSMQNCNCSKRPSKI